MNWLEIFWNNIGSLGVVAVVIIIVLTVKNAQIDSLKEQVNTLELLRPSGIEQDIMSLKNIHEEQEERLKKVIEELEKAKLSKKDAQSIVEIFRVAMSYASFAPTPHGMDLISQPLYRMKGPIGDLWREYVDEGKLPKWRGLEDYLRRIDQAKESDRSP